MTYKWKLSPSTEYGYEWQLSRWHEHNAWEYVLFAGAFAREHAITLAEATGGYEEVGIGE